MTDENAARLRDAAKLLEKLREVQAQTYAITEELAVILGGGEPWGKVLRRLETAFDSAWCSRYAPGQADQYSWTFLRDRPQLKKFYKRYGEADLIARFGMYITNDEPFFVKARHSFGAFAASINQHVPAQRASRPEWKCIHRPPCGSAAICEKNQILNNARRSNGRPLLVEEVEQPF
jgi:hypothetical protein